MKLEFSFTGLAVVPFALFMSFTLCTARPQHVRGHRHADHTRRANQRPASSGSSLYINPVGVTCKISVTSPHHICRTDLMLSFYRCSCHFKSYCSCKQLSRAQCYVFFNFPLFRSTRHTWAFGAQGIRCLTSF